MQKVSQARYGMRLPVDLVVKKTKEVKKVGNLNYSLELLKIRITDKITAYVVHGFNSRVGCYIEYFNLEDALGLWNSILVDDGLHLSEWYRNAKQTDENVKGAAFYSQISEPWFAYGNKIDAFEPALTIV